MNLSDLNEIKDPKKLDARLAELVEADMVKSISAEVKAKAKAQPKGKPAKKK